MPVLIMLAATGRAGHRAVRRPGDEWLVAAAWEQIGQTRLSQRGNAQPNPHQTETDGCDA